MARPKGLPKTGGRAKGSANKATAAKEAAIAASGLTPLEFMLIALRDDRMDFMTRFEAAKAAAPYVHPRLASTEVKGDPDNPVGLTGLAVAFVKKKPDDDGNGGVS
jgi:hypothetical protein